MTELGTALRELAERQRPIGGEDAVDLWSRGRRRVRRRRALGAAVVAAVIAAVGLGVVLVPEPVVVMPAGQVHAPGYPEHIYSPSRWLAGTDDQGPLGRLALVSTAEHGSTPGVFGVSATTGEYRFLDLPGWVEGSQVSLAPDGRHVAYWTTGKTFEKPYPDPNLMDFQDARPIAGVALYDTVTGRTQRTKLLTTHGMRDEGLFWVDADTVYLGDWQMKTRTGSSRNQFLEVSVGEPDPRKVEDAIAAVIDSHPNADGSFLVPREDGLTWDSSRGSAAASGGTGPITLPPKLPERYATGDAVGYLWVGRSDDRVVVQADATVSLSGPLLIGNVGNQGRVSGLTPVGDRFQDARVLGWHDDHTLLAYGHDRRGGVLASVDVRSGSLTVLSRDSRAWATALVPAADVLRGALVPGLEPPSPMDPRKKNALIALGGLGLVGAALLLVRRRRRA